MWDNELNRLREDLDTLRARDGVADAELGLAVFDLLKRGRIQRRELAKSPETRHALGRLAWWMFVRAPSLRPSYLVLSPMSLELVMNASRTLDETLDDLAMLEQADAEHVQEEPERPALAELMELFREHGELVEQFDQLDIEKLHVKLYEPLKAMLEHKPAIDALTSEVLDGLLDEFGQLGKEGALRELFESNQQPTGDLSEAIAETNINAAIEKGQRAYEAGELDEALGHFDGVLKRAPDEVDALVGRAVILATINETDAALASLDRAIELAPRHTWALLNRGLVRYALLQMEAAERDFKAALEVDDSVVEAWLNLASARAQQGNFDEALADIARAIELAPEMARPRVDRAVLYKATGAIELALEDYTSAIELDAYHADAWAGRGSLYLELGEFTRAREDLDRAIDIEPWRSVLYYNRGNSFAAQGELAEAIKDYDKVLEIEAEDTEALINRGTAKLKLDDLRGALEDWDQALRIDPYQPDAYLKRGVVLLLTDEPEHAAQDMMRALELAGPEWPFREAAEAKLAEAQKKRKLN